MRSRSRRTRLRRQSSAALDSRLSRYEELGTRPLVTRAALAEFDEARGPGARRDCGRGVERRTVVVYLESASRSFRHRRPSLSQGVVFVSRFLGDRYRGWRVVLQLGQDPPVEVIDVRVAAARPGSQRHRMLAPTRAARPAGKGESRSQVNPNAALDR